MKQWMVLKCDFRETVGVAETLKADNFDVWVPTLTETRRPHTKRSVILKRALLPGFVFGDYEDLGRYRQKIAGRLIYESGSRELVPKKPRYFTIFKVNRQVVRIEDCALDGLRQTELELNSMKPKRESFKIYEKVQVKEGPFKDQIGFIADWFEDYYVVQLSQSSVVFKISPFLLKKIAV